MSLSFEGVVSVPGQRDEIGAGELFGEGGHGRGDLCEEAARMNTGSME